MANKSKTKCQSCREIFTVDVRNRGRQKYCQKPECQRESKTASLADEAGEPQLLP